MLTIEVAQVTEAAAIAAARWRGRGDERQADQAAADTMRRSLGAVAEMDGLSVIGAVGHDQSPVLSIATKSDSERSLLVDVALAPLEGTTLCAKGMPDAISCLAMAEGGTLLHAPGRYMDKIAIGSGYPQGVVDLDLSPEENIARLARAKDVPPAQVTACILDRPRHSELIAAVRRAGASLRLISDGDIAGVIHTADPRETGIDIYLGIGGAPEGALAAAALRCIGGQMQGRLVSDRARRGEDRNNHKYTLEELASGDVIFAATGVTDGSLLRGVRFEKGHIMTETVLMRSATGTIRWITTRRRGDGNA
jgi:fructose-1,6-bisphosphatase II / sedoheptulose-1,7-bisphosphatase